MKPAWLIAAEAGNMDQAASLALDILVSRLGCDRSANNLRAARGIVLRLLTR